MNFFESLVYDIRNNHNEYIKVIIITFILYFFYINTCPEINYKNLNKYNDIKKNLNTGDLILFCSNDYIGRVIRRATKSNFSHCGMVIRNKGNFYILECDMDSSYDYITKQTNKNGVHLLDLDEKIDEYTGDIFGYCKLKNKIDLYKLKEILEKKYSIDFNNNLLSMYSSVVKNRIFSNLMLSENRMFCSEFIAYLYMKLGVIKESKYTNMYNPLDFENLFKEVYLFKKN